MKTYYANKDYVLVNGEVYFLSNEEIKQNDYVFDEPAKLIHSASKLAFPHVNNTNGLFKKIIATTDKTIPGVKHLDRNIFVKPAVDVEELWYNHFGGIPANEEYTKAFIKLYNSNPNQFTFDDMKNAFRAGVLTNTEVGWGGFDSFIEKYKDLSLPYTIQADDEFINVIPKWK